MTHTSLPKLRPVDSTDCSRKPRPHLASKRMTASHDFRDGSHRKSLKTSTNDFPLVYPFCFLFLSCFIPEWTSALPSFKLQPCKNTRFCSCRLTPPKNRCLKLKSDLKGKKLNPNNYASQAINHWGIQTRRYLQGILKTPAFSTSGPWIVKPSLGTLTWNADLEPWNAFKPFFGNLTSGG